MIINELIQRINCLAKKQKSVGLTPAESDEQANLRRIYIEHIKMQLKDTLEQIEIVDDLPDGGVPNHNVAPKVVH